MVKQVQLFGLLFLFCSPVAAGTGTIIEILNNNKLTTAITDGQKVRMSMPGSEYAIVDYRDHSVKLVDPQKQQVTLLSVDELASGSNPVAVRTYLQPQGPGQVIAGYQTSKYSYQANGKHCGTIYGSQKAYQETGVSTLVAALRTIMEQQRSALGSFASLVDACTLADMQLINHVNTLGIPMRTVKAGGVELEVRDIRLDVTLADNVFDIPESYQAVNMLGQVLPESTLASSEDREIPQSAPYYPPRHQVQLHQAPPQTPAIQTRSRRQGYSPRQMPPQSQSYRYPGPGPYYQYPRY